MKPATDIIATDDNDNSSDNFSAKTVSTFRALKHRNYRLFFFGQIISLSET